LAAFMKELDFVAEIKPAATNMVLFRLVEGADASALLVHLESAGIRLIAMDRHWLRAVLHYDVGDAELELLCGALGRWRR
jgi:hypothetical protein